jgi:hypothetical protein
MWTTMNEGTRTSDQHKKEYGGGYEDLGMAVCVIENNLKHIADFLDEISGKDCFFIFKSVQY